MLNKYKKQIDTELKKFLNLEHNNNFLNFNYSIFRNYLNSGKRLRPIALIMAYKAVGGKSKDIIPASLCVELLHNSTLIHDDIMDEDNTRRNKPSMHKALKDYYSKSFKEKAYNGDIFSRLSTRFGVSNAICNGNILYSLGESALTTSRLPNIRQALNIYRKAYQAVNEGQIMDNLLELKKQVTQQDYMLMIRAKTAALFKASVEIGAVLGNATKKQKDALTQYAMLTATAFQLQDDILDISGTKGNTFGSDIKKGKQTLLVIKALTNASKQQKQILNKGLGNDSATVHDIKSAIKVLYDTGAADYVSQLANNYVEKGKQKLVNLSPKYQDFFNNLADYLIRRNV